MRPLMLLLILFLFQANFLFAETPNEEKVRSYLSQQNEIRVWVSITLGYGHYSHSLSIMDELRNLGFHGVYRIIYAEFDETDNHANIR